MARLSVIKREEKRARMVKKFAVKRAEIKAVISNFKSSDEDRMLHIRLCSNSRVMRARFASVIAAR